MSSFPHHRALTLALAGAFLAGPALPAQQPAPGTSDQAAQEPTLKVDVNLVNVFFTVKAKKGGQLIPGLEKSNFTVFEDGKEQNIERFSRETDLPLTLGLLIDVSLSQEHLVDIERNAAEQFFSSVIRKKDEGFLISFGKETELLQDFTNSPRQLSAGLHDLQADPEPAAIGNIPVNPGAIPQIGTPKGTLMFDAVCLASKEKLSTEVGRKALILITDGEDEGSTYSINDAIEAAQRADAILYSIYYVDRRFYYSHGMVPGGGASDLRKMSQQTGGHMFTVDKKNSLQDIFQEIQDELRNQYSIGYKSVSPEDERFHKIEIRVDKPDDMVQARAGYYATKMNDQ